ncbi:MAG: Trans-aconitate 2-methyltransferase [Chlamydiae bacterium]|nr:Trans-aconitate 2-methyltransferase [Chlamydiota bacterium]
MTWDSTYYKEHATAQETSALAIIKGLNLRRDEAILDIGCGEGTVTRHIAERIPEGHVVGIDISEEMISLAIEELRLPNLRFECQGAESFTLQDTFDRVVSFHALHWVKDHASILNQVKKVLKPGGTLHFLMVSGGDERIGEVFEREPWKSEIQNYEERFFNITAEDYQRLLKEHGFTVERIEKPGLIHSFRDLDHLTNHFMTWVPYATGFEPSRARQMALEMAVKVADDKAEEISLETSTLLIDARL